MKKIISVLFVILVIACNKEKGDTFVGFGDLLIGKAFDSVNSRKLFEEVADNEFKLNKLELNDELGYVEDIKIRTKNGNIYFVSFLTGPYTNKFAIENKLTVEAQKDNRESATGTTNHSSNSNRIFAYVTPYDKDGLINVDSDFKTLYEYGDVVISYDEMDKVKNAEEKSKKAEYLSDLKTESKNNSNSLKVFSYEDVSRYALAVIMNQVPKKITVRKNGELYYATYVRESDNQRFDYKIIFEGQRFIWASIDGRWRNGSEDETIRFSEANGKLTITQIFGDGSQSKDVFNKGD